MSLYDPLSIFSVCEQPNTTSYKLYVTAIPLLVITGLVLVVSSVHTTRAATSQGRVLGELDVLLRIHVNHEGRGVHDLAADADVSLADQNTGVVNGLSHSGSEHHSLKSALHQLGSAQLQNVVELLLLLRDQSQTSHAADDGGSLEDTAGVLLVQGEELTSSLQRHFHAVSKQWSEGQRQRANTYLTDLGKDELHSPDLTLAAETELSANAELLVQTLALIGATGSAGSQAV